MKKFPSVRRWLSMGMLSAMLGTAMPPAAQAQRPIYIFDLSCVQLWGNPYRGNGADISIGRELYTSIMDALPFGITCRLPGGPGTIEIQYGVPDISSRPPAIIQVYVDGSEVARHEGEEGKVNTFLVDVSNGRSLAIDVNCSRKENCGRYHFFKFHLNPGASSPGS
ncbi:hypothetical protein [Planktothricoides raciborskii]|uniref:Uncharacterized protein n=1 Tax=Planktothricoides raciborskii FACHB-1370 TaxID=2949576 RepID=A0ABR8ECC7_9CYAN|nr:hypothetical protein [Planktothricoides raciborskii]MBD2544413.1 hypothetical protein [Planktothricoides raciborskii FACHB-1370]MBD2585506.1 hypothetical protein [Planktothricoides raciborskii FACHB-1261]